MTAVRNEIGKWMMDYRARNCLLLRDVALRLGISSSFLSNIELGRKPAPENWGCKVARALCLSAKEHQSLERAITRSQKSFTLEPRNEAERDLIMAFIDNKEFLDEEAASLVAARIKEVAREGGNETREN